MAIRKLGTRHRYPGHVYILVQTDTTDRAHPSHVMSVYCNLKDAMRGASELFGEERTTWVNVYGAGDAMDIGEWKSNCRRRVKTDPVSTPEF